MFSGMDARNSPIGDCTSVSAAVDLKSSQKSRVSSCSGSHRNKLSTRLSALCNVAPKSLESRRANGEVDGLLATIALARCNSGLGIQSSFCITLIATCLRYPDKRSSPPTPDSNTLVPICRAKREMKVTLSAAGSAVALQAS